MIDIKKSKIAVLGLGREGLDLLKFLNKQKPDVVMGLDGRTDKELANLSEIKKLTTNLYLGADHLKHFNEFDIVFKSPAGKVKLVRTTRPAVIDKKVIGANRRGASKAQFEYIYSDTETTSKMEAFREVGGEWESISADNFV